MIGLFGSFFLLGVVIGCITLTRLGDIVGRKPIFMLGMVMQICITIAIVIISNMYIAYVLCFLEGISLTGKQYVGYSYLIENQPKNKQVIVGSLEFIAEGFVSFLVCMFFLWVSKDWRFLMIPTIALSIFGTVMMFFQPESPRFLVSKGKFDEARKVFSIIARKNGKGTDFAEYFIFTDEIA